MKITKKNWARINQGIFSLIVLLSLIVVISFPSVASAQTATITAGPTRVSILYNYSYPVPPNLTATFSTNANGTISVSGLCDWPGLSMAYNLDNTSLPVYNPRGNVVNWAQGFTFIAFTMTSGVGVTCWPSGTYSFNLGTLSAGSHTLDLANYIITPGFYEALIEFYQINFTVVAAPTGTWTAPSCPSACGTATSNPAYSCVGGNGSCSTNTPATLSCAATASCPTCSNGATDYPTCTPPAPTLNLSAAPNPVAYNAASTLTWTTANATSCWGWSNDGTWDGWKTATSSSASTGALIAAKTYSLECWNSANVSTGINTVTVNLTCTPNCDEAGSHCEGVLYDNGCGEKICNNGILKNTCGGWTDCSKSCGGGTRSSACFCPSRTETQACNSQPCPSGYREVAPW